MKRLLLDTSGYSALLRGHVGVRDAVREADEIALTPIVLGELRAGFAGSKRLARNEAQLSRFLASPRVVVLPIDDETASRYAVIFDGLRRAGTPLPLSDVWIAASAMQHGHAVLTTDHDFLRIPQIVTEQLDAGASR